VLCTSCKNCKAGIRRCSTSREIAAERKGREQSRLARRARSASANFAPDSCRGTPSGFQNSRGSLPAALRLTGQFVLKSANPPPAASPRSPRASDLPLKIGHAILGDDNIAQMPRNGFVTIAPANIGLRFLYPLAALPRQSRWIARPDKRKSLRDKNYIVRQTPLTTLTIFRGPSENHRPHQGRHHRIVDEGAHRCGARRFASSSP